MKRVLLVIIFSFILLNAFAQNMATTFDVDGIKVIWKPTTKDIIHINMYYRGGVFNYPADKAGIENLALAAATECGTKKYPKDAFKDEQDAFGIEIGGSSGYDYGTISLNCISKYFNEGWNLFADAITRPVFEGKEFGLLKEKVISSVKQNESNPDDRINQLSVQHAFIGTPYAINPLGEEKTLSQLRDQDIKNYYYNQLFNKKRMFIVVVGNLSKEELISKIKASFSTIPSKIYTPASYKIPVFASNDVASEERKLATNYITGAFYAPNMNAPDYVAYKLAISTLGERLFKEIRTKRNLSYAPAAYSTNRKMPFGMVYVSTTNPKAAVQVMTDELKKVKKEGFTENELRDAKSGFITSNYMKEESTSAIAASLGNAEIVSTWKMVEEMPGKVAKVTLKEVNDSLKPIKGIKWTYLGDKKLMDEAMNEFNSTLGPGK